MTLSRKIADAVETAVAPPCSIDADAGPHRIDLRLTANGPVGVAFESLDFGVDTVGDSLSAEQLRGWGNRIAARVTYLMEPLVVLEVDAEAGEAELRSDRPTPRGEQRSYYEVRLNAGCSLRLRRFGFDAADRRRTVAVCQLTTEALERLVNDLVATAPPVA